MWEMKMLGDDVVQEIYIFHEGANIFVISSEDHEGVNFNRMDKEELEVFIDKYYGVDIEKEIEGRK